MQKILPTTDPPNRSAARGAAWPADKAIAIRVKEQAVIEVIP